MCDIKSWFFLLHHFKKSLMINNNSNKMTVVIVVVCDKIYLPERGIARLSSSFLTFSLRFLFQLIINSFHFLIIQVVHTFSTILLFFVYLSEWTNSRKIIIPYQSVLSFRCFCFNHLVYLFFSLQSFYL